VFPGFLAAEGGQVEVRVAVVELFDASAVGGVGVVDLLVDPEEGAEAGQFGAAHVFGPGAAGPGSAGLGQLGFGAEVEEDRGYPVVQRGVEVVVEVALVRRVPGKLPAHLGPDRGQFRVRRSGDGDQGGVADVEAFQAADAGGRGGAAAAERVPVGAEHEVVHHQLLAALEEVKQGAGTVRPHERVRLLDQDHRQLPALGVELVAGARQLLLLAEQFATGLEPLLR
jgi:hypothetical protein